MKSKSFFCLPSLFLLLGCSLSCKNKIEQRVSEQYQDSIEFRKVKLLQNDLLRFYK